jgi:hypothetical protein
MSHKGSSCVERLPVRRVCDEFSLAIYLGPGSNPNRYIHKFENDSFLERLKGHNS